MSARTLPLVFVNLGGEMLYILDQRLRAPIASEDTSDKGVWSERDRRRVLNDVTATLFGPSFVDELLKPQQLYSHRTLKTVLTRLAHASIMRLNPASMDRLYELTTMAVKHQVLLCPRPKDLLLVSYNHIDAVRDFVRDSPAVLNQVDQAHRRIIEVYSSMSEGELQLLRQTLLVFFQDMHVRVSLFLKSKIQNPGNGRFALPTSGPVPHGTEVPGLIRTFDRRGREVRRSEFPPGGSYSRPAGGGSFGLHGARGTLLGTNTYAANRPEETLASRASAQTGDAPNPLAKEELNLLARLMGSMGAQDGAGAEGAFRISMFSPDDEEQEAGTSKEAEAFEVISIQATQVGCRWSSHLLSITRTKQNALMLKAAFVPQPVPSLFCILHRQRDMLVFCSAQDEHVASELAQIAGQFSGAEEQAENPCGNKGDDLLAMMDDL
ncbi:protein OSCP1a isoform X2 [Betta splendens]|uniref:Protein OSCP1a isoform X2 n=1 Tax=Betta splendens TaxID=158456 RepID=A0A6P7P0R1_BETSP|nr:protein OSCP1a isoform X2 [Betta splendens]